MTSGCPAFSTATGSGNFYANTTATPANVTALVTSTAAVTATATSALTSTTSTGSSTPLSTQTVSSAKPGSDLKLHFGVALVSVLVFLILLAS